MFCLLMLLSRFRVSFGAGTSDLHFVTVYKPIVLRKSIKPIVIRESIELKIFKITNYKNITNILNNDCTFVISK